jgi:hypothetical protein
MFWNRSPRQIAQRWQDDVDQDLEAGVDPILEFGVSNLPVDSTPSLLALQHWSAQRRDISVPVMPAGGLGPFWFAAMMRPLPSPSQRHAPEPIVLYTGANDAESLASVTLLHAAVEPSGPVVARRPAIPASYFTPRSQPGTTISWDSLAFLETYHPPSAQPALAVDQKGLVTEDARADPIQDWLAWVSLLLALFLVLLAALL